MSSTGACPSQFRLLSCAVATYVSAFSTMTGASSEATAGASLGEILYAAPQHRTSSPHASSVTVLPGKSGVPL
eukprot:31364-Pelagococcus_subviridis.AAC.5